MTPKIRTLDPLTVNQIAAGEVIENASSVVKELVDNALDAGADEIFIETENGGRTRLVVEDNGHGMNQESLLLCVERYATSKIGSAEDLIQVKTMGFRGEALASIASISKMRLVSNEKEGIGASLVLHGGEILEIKPTPRKRGTSIEVYDLFYNTPVRRSFQKAPARDVAAIHRLLTQFIFSQPHVGFRWVNSGEVVLDVLKQLSEKERVEKMLGDSWGIEALPLFAENDEIKLTGFLAPEYAHRANRLGQYFFINGRSLHSSFLSRQLQLSYATRLPSGRFPQAVVHLKLPFHWVDVNVHPQKKEVRLCEEERIGRFLKNALDETLGSFELSSSFPVDQSFRLSSLNSNKVAQNRGESQHCTKDEEVEHKTHVLESRSSPAYFLVREPVIRFSSSLKEVSEEILPPKIDFEEKTHSKVHSETVFSQPLTLLNPFLLVPAEKGILLVHLERVYSALLRSDLKEREKKKQPPESQGLLLPLTLTFDQQECAHLIELKERLNLFGLQYQCRATQVKITALPPFLKEKHVRSLFEELLQYPLESDHEILMECLVKKSEKESFTFEEGKNILKECEKRGMEWHTFAHLLTSEEIHEQFKQRTNKKASS
jgi:DNA mismatch repair protein MutL